MLEVNINFGAKWMELYLWCEPRSCFQMLIVPVTLIPFHFFIPYLSLSFIVNGNFEHEQVERHIGFIAGHILCLHHNFISTIIIVRP